MDQSTGDGLPGARSTQRLDSFWLGVIEIDDDGFVRSANAAATAALGPDAAPTVGAQISPSAPWYSAALDNEGHDPVASRSRPVRHTLPDGSLRWLRVQAVPGIVDGRSIVLEDVTVEEDARLEFEGSAAIRSQLVVELDEANAQLERTNAELRRFAGAIAHDLKGPLSNIHGFVQLLPELIGEMSPETAEVVTRLERNARRSNTMISDLLEYARTAGSGEDDETVALGPVLDWVLQVQRTELESVQAQVVVGELPQVLGNEAALRQVFLNLIDNAVKYCRPEVPLRIDVRQVPSTDPELVEIVVEDNGRGIPRAERSRIFDLGARGGRVESPGSGIGLASCASVLGSMGGYIAVGPPSDDVGTTFVLGIPHAEVMDDATAPIEGTVMVIDDDPDVIQIVRLLASTMGLGIAATARTVAGALEAFDDLDEPPDVVILDLALPDGDGFGVARTLLARQPDLRILVQSGLVDDAVAAAAKAIGVAEVLSKTASDDDLVSALRRLVTRA